MSQTYREFREACLEAGGEPFGRDFCGCRFEVPDMLVEGMRTVEWFSEAVSGMEEAELVVEAGDGAILAVTCTKTSRGMGCNLLLEASRNLVLGEKLVPAPNPITVRRSAELRVVASTYTEPTGLVQAAKRLYGEVQRALRRRAPDLEM